jgi:hypothetical protein
MSDCTTEIPRFWAKVSKTDSCWNWKRPDPSNGYGKFTYQGRVMGAHRASWLIHYGPIPDNLWVLHRCDNHACIRPDHLFLGTHNDNMADMATKQRATFQQHPDIIPKGEQHRNAKLTDDQVREIRQLRSDGVPRRVIAQLFDISVSNVKRITSRKGWPHIE